MNHTFTPAGMDKAPTPADAPCDYATFTDVAPIRAEITWNRIVWELLDLPTRSQNDPGANKRRKAVWRIYSATCHRYEPEARLL